MRHQLTSDLRPQTFDPVPVMHYQAVRQLRTKDLD